jgi:hypothetical protein
MTMQDSSGMDRTAIGAAELRAIVGDVGEAKIKIIEILELRPTVAEVEEAMVWAAGDGDLLGKSGRPLSPMASAIAEILTADEEEPPPAR